MIVVLKEIIQLIRFLLNFLSAHTWKIQFEFTKSACIVYNVRAICVLNIFRALENQFEF